MIRKICKTCGKEFFVSPYRDKTALYCSHKCVIPKMAGWNKGTKGIMKANKTSFKKGERPSRKTEFKKGSISWNKGTKGLCKANLGSFKKGKHKSIKTEFKKGKISWNKGKKYFIKDTSNFGSYKGSKHWNWKGGITPENEIIRHSIKYKNWRKKIFERDNYTCQKCQQRGGELHADHIKPFSLFPKLRFDLSNGRTLCKECHKLIGWSLFKNANPKINLTTITKT